MTYRYDIFVSYRRNPETCRWISEHFVPLLELRVELELRHKPIVFVDDQIEVGKSYPRELGDKLGGSRVLILLWSGNYLDSKWCVEELSQMLAREKEAKLRSTARPNGVIIPAFIHDGDRFPSDLGHIQRFEIQDCFNVRMSRDSRRAEDLDAAIARHAPAIADCIRKAPAWRKVWSERGAKQFVKRYHQQVAAEQTRVPRFTGR